MLYAVRNKALETLRVLVLEDNPSDVRLFQEMLKDTQNKTMDIDVEYASCLSTALLLLEEKFFDDVFLDLSS